MYKKYWFYIVLLAHATVILYFWAMGSGSLFRLGGASAILALGRISGLILVSMALLQLLIMSRAPWLEQAFGLDKLARLHHKVGKYFIIFLIAHPLFIILSYAKFSQVGLVAEYLTLLKGDEILKTTVAFLLFLGIIVYSLLRIWKNWNFERWYYVHLAMYLAIIFAFGHQTELGGDFLLSKLFTDYWYLAYAFVAVNLLSFRFLTPLLLFKKHQFFVTDIKPETANVTSVYISGEKINEFPIRSGQFLIVRFLDKTRWAQAHPFSLSKSPDGKTLRLSIKASGDFSSEVSSIAKGTKVLIEGPYGIFTATRSRTNKTLLIAGGIGITPYMGMLEELSKANKDVVFIYGNKTQEEIALREELEELAAKYKIKIHHVLSNQDASTLSTRHLALGTIRAGFIDNELIKKLVPDVQDREVFLCGPPPMLNSLLKSLPSLGLPKNKIYFEKFSL